MPNITRGGRMGGLMVYLVGPGRHNEHTDPHLVAGDPGVMAWFSDAELGRESALLVAKHLDAPSAVFGTEVRVGDMQFDEATGQSTRVGWRDGHVWHCSLSLRAEEGEQTDQRWAEIAQAFVEKMGFGDEEGTKAGVRWAAVRHGVSTAGNDHVHLVVNLVREDGTKVSVHNDRIRAQRAARALEVDFGLEQLEGRERRATKGYAPAEVATAAMRRAQAEYVADNGVPWEQLTAAQRRHAGAQVDRVEPARAQLSRRVRACATAAVDEQDFVHRLRRDGLIIHARSAAGAPEVITGYSVALRPADGERPVWYGGGHLAKDLTLPRLRLGWPDTPELATAAAAAWTARPSAGARSRPQVEPTPEDWRRCTEALAVYREQLRQVPVDDHDTWSRLARDTAGAFAAWSRRVESEPGPLAAASDALAISAQTLTKERTPRPAGGRVVCDAAAMLAFAASGGRGAAAQLLMLRQLANLAKALFDMHRQLGELRRAEEIAAAEREHLRRVDATLRGSADITSDAGGTSLLPTHRPTTPSSLDAAAAVDRRRQQGSGSRDRGAER